MKLKLKNVAKRNVISRKSSYNPDCGNFLSVLPTAEIFLGKELSRNSVDTERLP
jgi:hypothetical protein